MIRVLMMAVLAMGLSACGFRPLYAERGPGGANRVGAVEVAPIPDRMGWQVRNELIRSLGGTEPADAAYRLDVTLAARTEGLAIQNDDAVTRYNYRLTVAYVLTEKATGKVLLDERTRAIASYNVVDSPYATTVAERDAEERTARQAAELIALRLATWFDDQGS